MPNGLVRLAYAKAIGDKSRENSRPISLAGSLAGEAVDFPCRVSALDARYGLGIVGHDGIGDDEAAFPHQPLDLDGLGVMDRPFAGCEASVHSSLLG